MFQAYSHIQTKNYINYFFQNHKIIFIKKTIQYKNTIYFIFIKYSQIQNFKILSEYHELSLKINLIKISKIEIYFLKQKNLFKNNIPNYLNSFYFLINKFILNNSYMNNFQLECTFDSKKYKMTIENNQLLIRGENYINKVPITLYTNIKWLVSQGQIYGLQFNGLRFLADSNGLADFKNLLKNRVMFDSFFDFYNIKQIIGKGGFSEVFEAEDKKTGQTYAVKCINRYQETKDYIVEEIKIQSELDHQNIAKLFEVYECGASYYLVMEKLQKIQLKKHDSRFMRNTMRQLLEALSYIHLKEIIHRDVKLSNLMQDDNGIIKLIDFGLSTKFQGIGKINGTPGYIAPEIFERQKNTQKIDIFSAGIVMYELFYNARFFQGKNKEIVLLENQQYQLKEAHFSKLSLDARDLIMSMLQPDPQKRIDADEALQTNFFQEETIYPKQIHNFDPKFIGDIPTQTIRSAIAYEVM
ncbi:hypothetical protein pb186bvf_017211 [Paramecium bursaria]